MSRYLYRRLSHYFIKISTLLLVLYIHSGYSEEIKGYFNNIESPLLSGNEQLKAGDINRFIFSDWAGPKIPVWVYLPKGVDMKKAPILIMMHGAKRGAHRYLKEWQPLAQNKGVIVIAPEFSKADFPSSKHYNLGYVFANDHALRKEEKWTFSSIESIFDTVVLAIKSKQTHYTIYGHSAGSQFVHRYLYYKSNARVKRYIAANAGWYTLPSLNEIYPYGLKNSGVSKEHLKTALSKDVVVLLGDQDTDIHHESLRRTPQAMRQGAQRFARGLSFYEEGLKQAKILGSDFGWKKRIVKGVAHSNGGMAKGAIDLVE